MEHMGFRLLPDIPQESNGAVTDSSRHWDKLGQCGDHETIEPPYLRILRTRKDPSVRDS